MITSITVASSYKETVILFASMPKTVFLFRVFVASPNDCVVERKIARQVVGNWNITHGFDNEAMLEAVLWETHSHPEMGERPQAIINRQILNSCDVLIAVFRSKLGSPTGENLSGTVEEIERFRALGKPVLLYFLEPTKREAALESASALTSFKRIMQERGLWASYRGHHDFQMKLSVHLALYMSRMLNGNVPQACKATADIKAEAVRSFDKDDLVTITSDSDPVSALRNIRDNTTFLWPDFQKYYTVHTNFISELRQITFSNIKPALDALVANGLLTYETESAYRLDESTGCSGTDDSLVLNITISAMTEKISQFILEVSQE